MASEDVARNHSAGIPLVSVAASSQSVAEDMDAEMNHSADISSVSVAASSQSVAENMDAEMNHSDEEPTEIIYVNKTDVLCLLCPVGKT